MVDSTKTPADRPSRAGKKNTGDKSAGDTNKRQPVRRWLGIWRGKRAELTTAQSNDVLWVDGVGGFLVLLEDENTIGQAIPGNDVHIPILGDLSRKHASIRRVDDMYLIEPHASVQVGGLTVSETTPLSDGDEISLGPSVQLRFRQASPLSDSARLDLLSHHRVQPSVDGILLFGQTCLLGPTEQNHICCPDWDGQIVLSRNDEQSFRFRANQRVEIDGVAAADTGILRWNVNISGSRFALRFERS